jgi:DNA-binding response OmpR family regulator
MSTLLIVDDEKNLLKLYQREFLEEGYEVLTASSGAEALEKLGLQSIDLIILDIRMPGLDGLETLKRVMESPSNPPIILNSAYSGFKDDFLSWAAKAYVVKSSDVSELKAKTREVLEAAAAAKSH